MDTRIGYPTEHLANNDHIENLTSPMYSTGIGLVLKGFENMSKIDMPTSTSATTEVKGHSIKTRGSFFQSIIEKGKTWFEEEK